MQRMKRRIRLMRVVQRSANLVMSVVVLGIMLNTYITFRNNRTQVVNGQAMPIYPTDAITWPTFMMITTASVSFLFNSGIILGYLRGVGTANRVSIYSGYWTYLVFAVNIVVWLVTTTTFKMVQGDPSEVPPPRDIWGWTCSDAVDALNQEIHTVVNFDLQCTTQVRLESSSHVFTAFQSPFDGLLFFSSSLIPLPLIAYTNTRAASQLCHGYHKCGRRNVRLCN